MGIASKISLEYIEAIHNAIADGQPRTAIPGIVKISSKTFYNWLKQGEIDYTLNQDTLFALMYETVEYAHNEFINRNLKVIQAAAVKDWKAAAWLLERRCPEHFALKQDTNMTIQGIEVKNDIPKIDITKKDEEKIA